MDRLNTRFRIVTGVLLVMVLFFLVSSLTTGASRIRYDEFIDRVQAGDVTAVDIGGQSADGEFAKPVAEEMGRDTFSVVLPGQYVADDGSELLTLLRERGVETTFNSDGGGLLGLLATFGLPLLLFGGIFLLINRQARGQMGPLGQIGKSQAKMHKPHEPATRFDDIAGYREVKQEVQEVVSFLREPDRFRKAGAEVPKGMLLVGPPGTGKTLIARATAGEAGVPFISVTGSDFMEMFVGVGASRVRDLFKTARENAPCIIFIDELDSIGRKRGAGLGGGHDEREQTLNQMLGEIDGFEGSAGVVIMAATNRPDVLDPALQRPGRFDRQIVVPLPTLEEREEILAVHAKGKPIGDDVSLATLARGTPGMSGADLKSLINEAALIAVRSGSDVIRMRDLEQARERQTIGRERASLRLDEEEKLTISYHESGHALAAFLEEDADPVYKVTCLPIGMALGVTTQLPIDERHIYMRSYLDARLRVMLGGRASELVVLGQPTTGAQNDLVQATKLARAIVREFGMGELGPVGYGENQQVFLGEELGRGHEYSEHTAELIDVEVQKIMQATLDTLVVDFEELRPGLDKLANLLAERESLTGEEALAAVRSGIPESEHARLRGSATVPHMAPSVEDQVHETDERTDRARAEVKRELREGERAVHDGQQGEPGPRGERERGRDPWDDGTADERAGGDRTGGDGTGSGRGGAHRDDRERGDGSVDDRDRRDADESRVRA